MKYKLSLSLLTCLALSLHGKNITDICPNGQTPCEISGTQEVIGLDGTHDSIKGNGTTFYNQGSSNINSLELTNSSSVEQAGGKIIVNELKIDTSSVYDNKNGTTEIKNIINTGTTNAIVKPTWGKTIVGDAAKQNTISKITFNGNGSFVTNNLILDNTVVIDVGYIEALKTTLDNSNVTIRRDAKFVDSILNNITVEAKDGVTAQNTQFNGGKLKAKGTYTNNTFTNTTINLDLGKDKNNKNYYMVFDGKNDFNSVKLDKTTLEPAEHDIVLKDNSITKFTNSDFTNVSINAYSSNDKNGSLTIAGGTMTNSAIGGAGTNLQNITLNGVNIDNSGLGIDYSIKGQNIKLENISSAKSVKVNAKTKLDMINSTLDSNSSIYAVAAEFTNSTMNGLTKADNTITSNGSIFNAEVKAKDLVSQKDTTSGTNSTFNGIVNITNSITASDTTFTKDVTANTINANNGSNFNANTTATNKITSDGAIFGGIVKANELETLTANKSTFKGNVDITNKITSTNASFEAQIKTAFLDAQKDSTFDINSNVIATDINAVGATFSGTIAKNNSITADSSTFEKAIDTNKLTASNGATFNGTVTANDLETLAGTTASSFTNTVNVTNTLTSANAKFTNNVTAGNIIANDKAIFGGATPTTITANTIIANNGSIFNGTTTANDSIIANAGSSFKGSTTATNKITSNGATFEKEVNTAFLEANANSNFTATSNINATDIKATGATFSGSIAKNNSITADSSSFANAIDTGKLIATNNSSFAGVTANTIEATNSTFGGIVTAADTITANNGANFTSEVNSNILIANNGSVFDANSKVVVTDSIIANAGSSFKGSVATDFLAADKGANFTGTTDVRQLYANGSVFGGKVSINCEDPAVCGSVISGSTFSDLELKNNTQAIIDSGSKVANLTLNDNAKAKLDNGSKVEGNLTLANKDNQVLIEGGSQITGTIENHGEIYVNNGTISSEITGTGDLFTSEVTYKENVSLSDIKGSGSTYEKDATATNSAAVDNSTFGGTFTVGGKLTANQGNKFNIVNANSADFLYDANKGASKDITANDINVTTGLVIDNINVTSNKISANTATIKNSANVSSLLTGTSDSATKVYDANITKGNTYNVDNSTIKGGIRADKLNTSKSSIHAQVATNTLNASNTTFYIYGNGTNTSFYDGYSGAIIAREGAIGGGNNIQLANTNLSLLTQGFVPVAIIKQSTPTGGVVTAAATSSIGEDFFKVTYKSKLAMYELVDKYKHFSDINGSYVWSVGVSGEDLVNNTNIDNVISGADSTNIANGANNNYNLTSLEVEVGDMFKPTEFDKEAIDTAKFILTSPDYIIRTKNNTLSKRFRALKDYKLGNGFWLDNQMGYAKYEYNAIRYKNMSVGIDKTHEFNNSDLTLGLAASVGRAETKGNLSSDADSKGFGIYALNKFNNNVFIGANAFYHNIASSYEAKMLDVKANKSHNVYEASIESGVRFGDKVYFEPSLKYHLTSYKPTAINQEGLVLKGDSQLKHELGVALEGGFKVPNVFDAYLAVGLSKELNHKPDLIFIDELKIQNKVDGNKGDTSVGINFGVDYKLSPNASFNIDLGSNLYTNSDKELKGNIGFSYKF